MINSVTPSFARSQFRKATSSAQDPQACVAVARGRGWVEIRDTKQEWGSNGDHRLVFTAEQFDIFLNAMSTEMSSEVKGAADCPCIEITRRRDGVNVFRSTVSQRHNNVLTFTDEEIAAFLHAVRHGEFAESAFVEPAAA